MVTQEVNRDTALNYLMGFRVEMRPRRDIVWVHWQGTEDEGPLFSTARSAEQAWHSVFANEEYDHQVIAVCGIPIALLGLDT